MSTLTVGLAYTAKKFRPRMVRFEAQNESYIRALYQLEQRQDSWRPDEAELADLFTLLIENFEKRIINCRKLRRWRWLHS